MTALFDCTPRMAAKLARCEAIARVQRERTEQTRRAKAGSMSWFDDGLTDWDMRILSYRAFPSPNQFDDRPSAGAYLATLNA